MDTSARSTGRATTVALVDDDDLVRLIAGRILELAGFRVVSFESADLAIEWIAGMGSAVIGLLVTDVEMPGRTDGVALASWLGTNAPDIPVLAVSANEDQLGRMRLLDNVWAVLAKPFTPSALARAARSAAAAPCG